MDTRGPVADQGIVLRPIALGDTSKIVSALTRDHGRVKLVAKGSRSLRSRFGPLLEPGNELDLVFYARSDRELWMLKEAGLVRGALTGGGSLPKLSHLLAALELADRLLPEREPATEHWGLYRGYLDHWHRTADAEQAALFFALELSILDLAGLGLEVDACAECGRRFEIGVDPRVCFRAVDGTLECDACARGQGRWIDGEAWAALRAVAGFDPLDPAADLPGLDDAGRREVGRLLHEHLSFHLANYRIPKSLYWLRSARESKGEREA